MTALKTTVKHVFISVEYFECCKPLVMMKNSTNAFDKIKITTLGNTKIPSDIILMMNIPDSSTS